MGERLTSAMLKKLIENLTLVQKESTDKLFSQMKEVNINQLINKKVSDSLQHSLDILYLKFDDMWTEKEKIKEDVKTVKLENEGLTKKMFDIKGK